MLLSGKTSIVTGAGRGIGKAIAIRFAREGCNVSVPDIDLGGAKATANEIEEIGSQALAMRIDVSKSEDVEQMVCETIARWGRVDILVNNAGICILDLIVETKEEDWVRTLDVNSKGLFLCTRAAARQMIKQGAGKIINIASMVGVVGYPTHAAYSASKGSVVTFTKVAALELAPHGINVNAISPGVIITPMSLANLATYEGTDGLERLVAMIPLGRRGQPEDIGSAALFLASSESDYITGVNLPVDGGWLAQ